MHDPSGRAATPTTRKTTRLTITELLQSSNYAQGRRASCHSSGVVDDRPHDVRSVGIARRHRVRVVVKRVDGSTRTFGAGPTIALTGDVRTDMDTIRAFYATKTGVHAKRVAVPRLPSEDE